MKSDACRSSWSAWRASREPRSPHAAQDARHMPPAWPYGQPPLAPRRRSRRRRRPQRSRPLRSQRPAEPQRPAAAAPCRPTGSTLQFTQQQINNSYGAGRLVPGQTIRPMPECGRARQARRSPRLRPVSPARRPRPARERARSRACRTTTSSQQMHDFQQGLRHSSDPRKANTLRDGEHREDAERGRDRGTRAMYFSSMHGAEVHPRRRDRDDPEDAHAGRNLLRRTATAPPSRIGNRIIETPEDTAQTQMRNPRSGFDGLRAGWQRQARRSPGHDRGQRQDHGLHPSVTDRT